VEGRSEWTGDTIRNVELSRTYFGGVDEAATRELLAKVAASVDASALELVRLSSERNELAQRVRELEAALDERVPEVSPEGYTEQALSHLIRDARQRFDDLLREANAEAANVKTAAAAEAEQLLDDARVDLQTTQESVVELHTLLVDTSNSLVEALETALRTVEALEISIPARSPVDSIVEDLWPSPAADIDEAESSHAPGDELEGAEVQSAVSAEPDSENRSY
jgi:cell division septum initiation protein DivIVA